MQKLVFRSVATDIDVYHDEHEFSLRMAERKKEVGTPKQVAAPKRQRHKVKPTSTIVKGDN